MLISIQLTALPRELIWLQLIKMATIPGANTYAITLKNNASAADIIATGAIYSALKGQSKKVEVLSSKENPATAKLKTLVPGVEVKTEIPPKQFVLSFKKGKSTVDKVQWQQDDAAVNIYVTLTKGMLNLRDINLKRNGTDYELMVLPGIAELGQLGSIAKDAQATIADLKLFSIGTDLNLGDNFQHTSSKKPELTTLSEQVVEALDAGKLSQEVAQLLYAGIMIETSNLTKPIKSSEIFVTLKKLADKGATPDSVKSVQAKVGGAQGSKPQSNNDSQGKSDQKTENKSGDTNQKTGQNSGQQKQSGFREVKESEAVSKGY